MLHPDKPAAEGPEIDFGMHTEHVVLLGEAKWLSRVGKGQGRAGDKNQLGLRREFFEKYGSRLFPTASHHVLLTVSPHGELLTKTDVDYGTATLHLRDLKWNDVCSLDGHPLADELRLYLDWKWKHSRLAQ